MCGICGTASLQRAETPAHAEYRVRGMVEALAHRGPDQSGQASSCSAVLGATRLAIRGLHDGRQPIVDRQSGVMVVCNGEIDNHHEIRKRLEARGRRVESATDVAVIGGLYLELGERFIEELVGAFALAVWDPRKRLLLLARDRIGERSLFFTFEDGEVSFATEVAALAAGQASGLDVNVSALHSFLRLGIFPSPQTPFVQIHKVSPAEIVAIDTRGVRRRRYWRWNIGNESAQLPRTEEFDAVFREAVRRQSEIDVEFGLFLSGGLDSSLVAAVVKSVRPDRRPKAFTLRFREDSYDEGSYAEHVARELKLESVSVWVKPEDFPREISRLIESVGEPLADPAWVPTALLARRAADDFKLALVGEGGDELFGGYPTYLGALWADRYTRLPVFVQRMVRSAVDRWPPSDKKVSVSFLLKRFVAGAKLNGLVRHRLWTAAVSPLILAQLGIQETAWQSPTEYHALLDAVQQHDLETTLADGLLTKADRASMASALELRSPFLDKAVVEFAATLPVHERVRGLRTKVFLKQYAASYLPASIIHRRKRGLSVPLSSWLRGPLHDWAESHFNSGLLSQIGIERRAALKLFEQHCCRQSDHGRPLWALLVLCEWLRWARNLN